MRAGGRALHVAAQAQFESEVLRRFIILQFQELSSKRFQHGFHRFNLHRPTFRQVSPTRRRDTPSVSCFLITSPPTIKAQHHPDCLLTAYQRTLPHPSLESPRLFAHSTPVHTPAQRTPCTEAWYHEGLRRYHTGRRFESQAA